jgi:hypothetical protein
MGCISEIRESLPRHDHVAAGTISCEHTFLVLALAAAVITPASNRTIPRSDSTGMIASDTCADLLKDIFWVRRRGALAHVVFAPALHGSIGPYAARERVAGRYLTPVYKSAIGERAI